jgi:hypothetical protein
LSRAVNALAGFSGHHINFSSISLDFALNLPSNLDGSLMTEISRANDFDDPVGSEGGYLSPDEAGIGCEGSMQSV